MNHIIRISTLVLWALLLGTLVGCIPETGTPEPEEENPAVGGQISATARNNQVNILRAGGQPEVLPALTNQQLTVGERH